MGRTIAITGASAGIGQAIAQVYAKEYPITRIILLARRLDRLQEVQKNLQDLNPQLSVDIFQCDVTDEEQLKRALNRNDVSIDTVYANAGFGLTEYFENLSNEMYKRQFETNIFGVINTVRGCFKQVLETRGRIALIGSVSGYVSTPADSPYSMSKAAIRAFADTLYHELSPRGVSVTLIAPGFVKSEIRHKDNNERLKPDSVDIAPAWSVMDTYPAAQEIVAAVEKRKREAVITRFGRFLVWLRRHFPSLSFRLVNRVSRDLKRARN